MQDNQSHDGKPPYISPPNPGGEEATDHRALQLETGEVPATSTREYIAAYFSELVEKVRADFELLAPDGEKAKVPSRRLAEGLELVEGRRQLKDDISYQPIDALDILDEQFRLNYLVDTGNVAIIWEVVKRDLWLVRSHVYLFQRRLENTPNNRLALQKRRQFKEAHQLLLEDLISVGRKCHRLLADHETHLATDDTIALREGMRAFYTELALNQLLLISFHQILHRATVRPRPSWTDDEEEATYIRTLEREVRLLGRELREQHTKRNLLMARQSIKTIHDLEAETGLSYPTLMRSIGELEDAGHLPARPDVKRPHNSEQGKKVGGHRVYNEQFFENLIPLLREKHPRAQWNWLEREPQK